MKGNKIETEYIRKERIDSIIQRSFFVIVIAGFIIGMGLFGFHMIHEDTMENSITSGIIINKEFVPAHTRRHLIMIGKMLVPSTQHIPDHWSYTISGQDSEGYTRTITFDVDKNVYDTISVGSNWSK